VAVATVQDTDHLPEHLVHITVVVVVPGAILIQVQAVTAFKVLSLYDIEIDKGKIWQRYQI
jgi:hypothetical protein